MGLAASQARLLTITARKADCEFMSMNLSHQKLALSRSMEQVSSEYQNSLNQTKLVYDYYGSGDSDMALTYGLLMSPSVYNDYYPKIVTDSKNRVVLNSAYALAARAAGIPAEGLLGTPSSDVRNAFVESLANYGIITPAQAVAIQGVTYNNTLGLGNGISSSAGLTDITYKQLIELFDANAESSLDYGVLLGSSNQSQDDKYQRFIRINGSTSETIMNSPNSAELTISQLLSNDVQYNIAYESKEGKSGNQPVDAVNRLQSDLIDGNMSGCNSVLDWIKDQFGAILGGTAVSDTAIDYAYNCLFDLIQPNNNVANAIEGTYDKNLALSETGNHIIHTKNQNGFLNLVSEKSPEYLGIAYSTNRPHGGLSGLFHSSGNDNTTVSINLNNLAQAFLTSYVQYMQGIDNTDYSWQKGEKRECNLYNPEKDDFMFTIVTETDVDMGDSQLYANFYDTLFNQICVNGWVENEQIDDEEYMTEMLKSGMTFISSMSDDGYYYQGNYSTDRHILEVSDTEAIAKAEAKYNTEKTKIENKEETIDLKMKNLDTEISSLTTEYDTTKSVISKAIEKSFKRYEA